MELILIRHGLPVRVEEEVGTRADPELDELGWQQAEALADWLADEPIDVLVTSPMRRAVETAQPLAKRKGLDVIVDDELAEFDRGMHFYIPIEELKASKDPRWNDIISGRLGPNGEVDPLTFRDVVVEAMEKVIDLHAGKTVAVTCHGGVINAYISHILKMPDPLFFEPAYTSISRILASRAGHRQLKSVNETAHVRGLLPPPAFPVPD
jgi:2,3-bisphosphoglycerate-dependent phosphoglycerate mutase